MVNVAVTQRVLVEPSAEAAAPQLDAETLSVDSLSDRLRRAMFELYATYYDATDEISFNRDLNAKDHVVLVRDEHRELCGFSALATLRLTDSIGQPIRAIYSGDTVVDHRYWGQQALAFHWIRMAGRIARRQPQVPLYWFLIVKGHRTYRYLHAFTRRYYPHWRDPTPPRERALMHRLGAWRFGRAYDARSGRVRFARSRGQLASTWCEVEASSRARPEVAYFLERNPDYSQGDELVCLTRLEPDNLRPLARRIFERGNAT